MASTDYSAQVDLGKDTCTFPGSLKIAIPYSGDWTFNRMIACVSAILTVLTIALCLANITRHLRNYSCPVEQRHIVRIIWTPIVFAICNVVAVLSYEAADYVRPVAELYEAIPLATVFLLFIAYVVGRDATDDTVVDEYFTQLERRKAFGKGARKHSRGSLRWFYVYWILVFQIVPCKLILTIAKWITKATDCPLDDDPVALRVLTPVFMIMWIIGTLRFYRRLRPQLKPRKAFLKMASFKLIVFLQIVQDPILSGLLDAETMKPTEHISYEDWAKGLPSLIIVVEMFFFSILFFFTFSAKEYLYHPERRERGLQKLPEHGFWAAFIHTIDIRDILAGCLWHKKLRVICSPSKAQGCQPLPQ